MLLRTYWPVCFALCAIGCVGQADFSGSDAGVGTGGLTSVGGTSALGDSQARGGAESMDGVASADTRWLGLLPLWNSVLDDGCWGLFRSCPVPCLVLSQTIVFKNTKNGQGEATTDTERIRADHAKKSVHPTVRGLPVPANATGARDAENRRKGILERWPMIMFCGLPTSVATLPRLALIASANR